MVLVSANDSVRDSMALKVRTKISTSSRRRRRQRPASERVSREATNVENERRTGNNSSNNSSTSNNSSSIQSRNNNENSRLYREIKERKESRDTKKVCDVRNDSLPLNIRENVDTTNFEPHELLRADKLYVLMDNNRLGISSGSNSIGFAKVRSFGKKQGEDIVSATLSESFPPRRMEENSSDYSLLGFAVVIQRFWRRIGFIEQGLLAGVALMHLTIVLDYRLQADLEHGGRNCCNSSAPVFNTENHLRFFGVDCSTANEIYSAVFSFLILVSLISVLDKFDETSIGVSRIRDTCEIRGISLLLCITAYLSSFSLHLIQSRQHEESMLLCYEVNLDRVKNVTTRPLNVTFVTGIDDWRGIIIAKDFLAIFAWLCIAWVDSSHDAISRSLESKRSSTLIVQ